MADTANHLRESPGAVARLQILCQKANWQLLIPLQEVHRMLRLRISFGNSLRARLEAQRVCETHLGGLWFSLATTPSCRMKRKGRAGQNIHEY